MKTAFVTGGSGFVGRNLIRRLRRDKIAVAALARSEAAANAVAALGARPVRGDLLDRPALSAGMQGCDVVFHAAACVDDWGLNEHFWRINVAGTECALQAAQDAGVARFIHVGTEAIFADGRSSLENLDESRQPPAKPLPRYPLTKLQAEQRVLAANRDGFACISIRPRLIWGNDDSSVLPKILQQVQAGKFVWPDQGRALTSTCHVDNVCEALCLAAEKGCGGEAYFVTDGAPISYRQFLGAQFRLHGYAEPKKSVPLPLASIMASACEALWQSGLLPGHPPVHRLMIELGARPVTINDKKIRQQLGYKPVTDREQVLQA